MTASGWKGNRGVWLLGALMVITLATRLGHVGSYPFHEDEAISITAMRSIAQTGFPLLENGAVYWRSLVAHYLMAVPLLFLEVSPLSTRFVSLLFSVALLPIAFLMGRVTDSRLAGWLSASFLAFSAYENLFASMARFYLPFQLFFLAAVYFSGSFFIDRRPKTGLWLLLSILGAIGTHEFCVELVPVVLLGAVLGRRSDLLKSPSFLASCLAVAAIFYMCVIFRPEGSFENYAAIPLKPGGLKDKLAFFEWFRRAVPFGSTLLLLALVPLGKERNIHRVYYFVSFFGLMIALSLVAPDDNVRYFSNLFPLGVILACGSLAWWLRKLAGIDLRRYAFRRPSIYNAAVVLTAAAFLLTLENVDVAPAFGRGLAYKDQRPAHEFIRRRMLAGDLVISTEPGLTALYLGRLPDFFLREHFDPASGKYRSFSGAERQGMIYELLDSPRYFQEILSGRKRIWLYANHKIAYTVSPETDRLIRLNFTPAFVGNETYVLVRQ